MSPCSRRIGGVWQAFENSEYDYEATRQMATHATARYFVLFLQERGRLPDVFQAFQQRTITSGSSDPREEAASVLTSVLARPLDEVDVEFAAWFGELDH